MMDKQTHLADLTVGELMSLIRDLLREELHHDHPAQAINQAALLELEPLHVGQWPAGLKLLSREEYYEDER